MKIRHLFRRHRLARRSMGKAVSFFRHISEMALASDYRYNGS